MSDSPDVGKIVLGLGLLGLAGWLTYTFVIKPGQAPAPSGPIQPGPGPGNLPAPAGAVGDSAVQGDTVLVSTAKVGSLPSGLPPTVEMKVTGAQPGSSVVIAMGTGRDGDGLPSGTVFVVPRSEITAVSHGGRPVSPPPAPPAAFVPVDMGDPMNLANGHHYRARIHLDGFSASLANAQFVGQQFSSQGFSDVQVFGPGDALPADWPPSTVVAPGDKGTYYALGTWGGPTGPVPRPPQIAMAWEQ
jgi:hypothetical protein